MKLGIVSLYLLSTFIVCNCATAQISSDGTLSTDVSTNDDINFLIQNGDRTGDNLFHSFSEFSIPNLGVAYFNNDIDVVNIFSRVTGGNISEIQGLIRANGTANLFLINPAGIIFGENASLDIGGSFFASTAESIVFGEGLEFSATQPQEAPLLTVHITPGLQMGSHSGDITVRGNGHQNIYLGANVVPFNRSISTRTLEVSENKTIGLLGANIFFESGVITAEGGNIQIGAVTQNDNALVNLNTTDSSFSFEYEGITNFGNIQLNERSLIDASGVGSSSIHLQGKQIELNNASVILIHNLGDIADDGITVNATESLTIQGNSLGGLSTGNIFTEALSSGKGGDVTINTQQLRMYDGSQLGARTFGLAAGGNLSINSTELIELNGFAHSNPSVATALGAANFGTAGPSGDVVISTNKLNISNGASVVNISLGVSDGGNVTVEVGDIIDISGAIEANLFQSNIGVFAYRSGDAGDLRVNASKIILTNSGEIHSSTLASGDAGNLVINASESIEVEGEFVAGSITLPSEIVAESQSVPESARQALGLPPFPTGESGSLTINTPTLRVLNGGKVSVGNDSTNGNAGSLDINADNIFLDNRGSLAATATNGQGGNINVTTNNLNVSDRATVSVSSFGSGKAGNLTINANSINLDNQGSLQGEVTEGNQGNINLNSQLLLLRNNSNITTNAGNQANGGNITIDTVNLVALENSDITANAVQGQGGNIIVTAQGLFLSPDSQITASSQFGVDGVVTINNPEADNSAALLELPKETTDPSQQIAEGCAWVRNNSFIVTGRGGTPKNPSNNLDNDQMWSDIRDLSNNQSDVTSQQLSVHQPVVIEANTWIINEQGNVELVAVVNPQDTQHHLLAANCAGQ